MTVLVVGGGWAGLAAAVELSRHGRSVTVLESARQLGGRARAVRFGPHHVDNGQHILLGAYRGVLHLLRTLGVPEHKVLRRLPLTLDFIGNDGPVSVRAPQLPAPLHLLFALLTGTGLRGLRGAALRFALQARWRGFRVDPDRSLASLLQSSRQPPRLVKSLWEPLCLAALNTPIEQASANLFLRVLRDAFFARRRDSDLLLPTAHLSDFLVEPASDFIERHGGSVRLGVRVQSLQRTDTGLRVSLASGEQLDADQVVLAVPARATRTLLAPHPALAGAAEQLAGLDELPICTLYLQYPPHTTLGRDLLGLLDSTAQWIFDRGRLTGEAGLMAVVVSGPGAHMRADADSLTTSLVADIARRFPHWPPPLDARLIRERRATFAAAAGVDAHRPGARTAWPGLYLAGDHTATGYPATLEGAVRSGLECARLILNPS